MMTAPKPAPRRRLVRLVLVVLLALPVILAVLFGLWRFSNARTVQLAGELVARVETDRPLVALTFDDGPTPEYTASVLALLAEKDVPATFFVTGREVSENMDAARAIVEAGHVLANHSFTHPRMVLMSPGRVAEEIEATDAAIREAGFEGEILFRPPYAKKLVTLPLYLWRHDRTSVTWDVEPESDPAIANDPDAIVADVLERARPGSIVLLHLMYASREASREALPRIIEGLRAKGYTLVTVPELLAAGG